ncbi:hypothetical protein FF38_12613 [Lucilia cuprina]|uniref:Uncharacterized protein n=1 Tax=Lucilia cuprina TaxID=7375 RepID=A0A0L0BN12_LUCCU|nr:hypothetical protein FF38_12613 [Lucilia cuprina]
MFILKKLDFIILILVICCSYSQANTKVLRKFSVALRRTLRDETISLNDEGNLIVEGGTVQKFSIPNDDKYVQKLDIVFVADKDGYRPIFILVKEKFDDTHRLAQFLAIILVLVLSYTQGQIQILREVNVLDSDSQRQETISLKNENTPEEELIIEGTHVLKIYSKDYPDFVYRIETIYVADKDGYRVKYKLIREPIMQILLGLSPSTLKSTAGDTKVLRQYKIGHNGFNRQETISLKNENELIIEGQHVINSYPYKIETIYVADKDGYRVVYKLISVETVITSAVPPLTSLNPNTLKTAAG